MVDDNDYDFNDFNVFIRMLWLPGHQWSLPRSLWDRAGHSGATRKVIEL